MTDFQKHHIVPIRCPKCGHCYELKQWPKYVRYKPWCFEHGDEEHLHLKCDNCKAYWAMDIAPPLQTMDHTPTRIETKDWLDKVRSDRKNSKERKDR